MSKDILDIDNSMRGKKRPAAAESEQESEQESERESKQESEHESEQESKQNWSNRKCPCQCWQRPRKTSVNMLKLNWKHITSLKVNLRLH